LLNHIRQSRPHTFAGFDFVRDVTDANSQADLVRAWTTFIRKQFDMLTAQTKELAALSQKFAIEIEQPRTRGQARAMKGD